MKKLFIPLLTLLLLIIQQSLYAETIRKNDLRELFINGNAVIYTINIRTFSAKDLNGNDIIEPELGEESGNFVSAIDRLDDIKNLGINTIYLLPITKTGKLKALGTAGSLYALDSFDEISPYLDKKNNNLSVKDEAKIFVEEAHKRGLRVIVDLPACGSYDFSLTKPDLFLKNKNDLAIIPADWTDVRLFKVYNSDNELNQEFINEVKKFINLIKELQIDGIRADVAAIKSKDFWEVIINYARKNDPNFMFVAEASPNWKNPSKPYTDYESVKNLLNSGFDGYYANYSNLKSITNKKELIKKIKTDEKILKKFDNKKSTLLTFATHDQNSPVYDGGKNYWETVLWLNITIPKNSYFLDGFPSGDDYIYKFENKKAQVSHTDDDYYFVHSGKFDIFNLSRSPKTDKNEYYEEFMRALSFKSMANDILNKGKFKILNTNSKEVFAYATERERESVITVLNLDSKLSHKTKIYVKGMNKDKYLLKIKGKKEPNIKRGKMVLTLEPNEVQVYVFSKETI